MTKLTFGKRDVEKVARVIEPEYDNLDKGAQEQVRAIASAALDTSTEVVLDRAKFTVVGQFTSGPQTRWVGRGEADASKGCLGFFSTAGDAQKAAESLTYSTASHEEWRAWVLPVEHKSAAEFHASRKAARLQAAAEELAAKAAERDPEQYMRERAAEVEAWFEALPEREQKRIKKLIGEAEWASLLGMIERSQAA